MLDKIDVRGIFLTDSDKARARKAHNIFATDPKSPLLYGALREFWEPIWSQMSPRAGGMTIDEFVRDFFCVTPTIH